MFFGLVIYWIIYMFNAIVCYLVSLWWCLSDHTDDEQRICLKRLLKYKNENASSLDSGPIIHYENKIPTWDPIQSNYNFIKLRSY